ncbi:MAG: nicotinate-nucleotide--dimethylbenzimidazole phosphoribosyltransferase [Gammaproteobacteria bacterium]|nr:nicotinate-nucleotide--dimethylbenzimidazole phosphoribosyltransferase [Gammaproteobacteria bacterium]
MEYSRSEISPKWLSDPIYQPSAQDFLKAQEKQEKLTKPKGSLGLLESIAIHISALQKTLMPEVETAQIIIFAADHGIAQENVSAFPQVVTAEMVKNFSTGGAAISVLSRQHRLALEVVNLGLVSELDVMDRVANHVISKGTCNFKVQAAMTREQLIQSFNVAKSKIENAFSDQCQLLIFGEMGIANTTSASALVCALESMDPEILTGSGTGIDSEGVAHKIQVIKDSLAYHQKHRPQSFSSPLSILQTFGGYEIAALTASYIHSAQKGIISIVDGFICSVAALFAVRIKPECKAWLIFSHQSAEQGHKIVLELIAAEPLLQFNLRLGEASGAALVYPLIHSACLLQNEMDSFSSASVSTVLDESI